jgi:hypothetical protein
MWILRTIALFGILLGALGGCATVPLASPASDADAKTFSTTADKSVIYVYRNERFGGAARMGISLDGKLAGQSAPKTYFAWVVDPGPHELVSHSENVDTLRIVTEPGKAYYVWQEAKVGIWGARSQLHLVDAATGQQGVAECRLARHY